MDKRLIEDELPYQIFVKDIIRDRNFNGHISTSHVWWARRPISISRIVSYAALVSAAQDELDLKNKIEFLAKLANNYNLYNNKILSKAKQDILEAYNGNIPKVIDVFAGGGSIPLELMRLGCETYALDYNPVAVLLLKCVLEYTQKFSDQDRLYNDILYWGRWIYVECQKELAQFYTTNDENIIPIKYVWIRTIPCINSACGREIPLKHNWLLFNTKMGKLGIYPQLDSNGVTYKLINLDTTQDIDINRGSIIKGNVICPFCKTQIKSKEVKSLFLGGKSLQRLVAIGGINTLSSYPNKKTKTFIEQEAPVFKNNIRSCDIVWYTPTEYDLIAYHKAEIYLKDKHKELIEKLGIDPLLSEEITKNISASCSIILYGLTKFEDLFNARQKLAAITMLEKIHLAYNEMIKMGYDKDYARVIASFMALLLDKMVDYNSNLCSIKPYSFWEIYRTFFRGDLSMSWDYLEINPYTPYNIGLLSWLNSELQVVRHMTAIANKHIIVEQGSATMLPYPDNYFDAVITDPPYFDNISYSTLSNFFYVWLKRAIGKLYPELFVYKLTPTEHEIVDSNATRFSALLSKACCEIERILKPNGIAVIMFACKRRAGLEALYEALLSSNLTITRVIPLLSEMITRRRSIKNASLMSSLYIVCRKYERKLYGNYSEVYQELIQHLQERLTHFWNNNIVGADFTQAVLGAGLEVIGKYKAIVNHLNEPIYIMQLIDDIIDIAINIILKWIGNFLDNYSRFYVHYRRLYGNTTTSLSVMNKLCEKFEINLQEIIDYNKGIIKTRNKFALLEPHKRSMDDVVNSSYLIDKLHYAIMLHRSNNTDKLAKFLVDFKSQVDTLLKLGQAISIALLNYNSQERAYIDYFLQKMLFSPNSKSDKNIDNILIQSLQGKLC